VPDVNCANGTNPGRTHRFFTGKSVIPFGFGLSYTSFKYDIASAPTAPVSLDRLREVLTSTSSKFISKRQLAIETPLVSYSINVTNTGDVDSDDVVLGFLVPPGAGTNGIPLQSLYGFERVHLKAGETKTVGLYPELDQFSQVGTDGQRFAHPGEYTFRFGVRETTADGGGFAEHTATAI
jgi:hypothetical protein